jgi:Flp pilus assembly protein TadG
MIQRPDRLTKRNRRRSGTVIIELGLMLLPTFAIIFGFLDIGFAIFTWNTLQNAAREGTRYAITMQVESGYLHRQSIRIVTARWALGFVNANSTSTTGASIPWVQVDYYSNEAVAAASAVTPLTGNSANDPNNIVEVSIRNYPYKWMFPFSGTMASPFYASPGGTLSLNVYSADVLGGTGVATKPLPGT